MSKNHRRKNQPFVLVKNHGYLLILTRLLSSKKESIMNAHESATKIKWPLTDVVLMRGVHCIRVTCCVVGQAVDVAIDNS